MAARERGGVPTTRAERLAEAARRTKDKLHDDRQALRKIEAAQRAEQRTALARRKAHVGDLADEAGLLVLGDADLRGLFALLASLTHLPDPVAVLEARLYKSERLTLGEQAWDGTRQAR